MKIKLSKELLGSLPAPDSEGLVRATAALRITGDGEADLLEINDSPVSGDSDDDEAPMPSQEIPDLSQAPNSLY